MTSLLYKSLVTTVKSSVMEPLFLVRLNMNRITVHCSATQPDSNYTVEKLHHDHVTVNGWSDIGYHRYITRDGVVHHCRPLSKTGAHVRGHNKGNIGICLEGGIDQRGKSTNNFTPAQFDVLRLEIIELTSVYGIQSPPLGHRDWSPDLDGDGTVEANEFIKDCPCFDVKEWWKTVTE
ncbi:N-acetylmuramoyl-L-alanine amidase [Vibrio phage 489E54-1]|nr:N-acetylmuramoyl-L-alanine amidase [Vibrio phage 489E54-1]